MKEDKRLSINQVEKMKSALKFNNETFTIVEIIKIIIIKFNDVTFTVLGKLKSALLIKFVQRCNLYDRDNNKRSCKEWTE